MFAFIIATIIVLFIAVFFWQPIDRQLTRFAFHRIERLGLGVVKIVTVGRIEYLEKPNGVRYRLAREQDGYYKIKGKRE